MTLVVRRACSLLCRLATGCRLDGLLLTGAVSNIEPRHYEGGRSWPGNLHDPARDANAFALLREALAQDLPVLAICRGFQELNVALVATCIAGTRGAWPG